VDHCIRNQSLKRVKLHFISDYGRVKSHSHLLKDILHVFYFLESCHVEVHMADGEVVVDALYFPPRRFDGFTPLLAYP
jgi:hypothetical protein